MGPGRPRQPLQQRFHIVTIARLGLGQRQGKLVFVDSAVDASSGTVKAKAQFDNKDQALWPGAYVTVKMAVQTLPDAVVVPQAAIVSKSMGMSSTVSVRALRSSAVA